ncbi:uncharacterized protein EV154DRAFT_503416, partial [Mucor mucedo]|uniref:uncharacterized protein n=1 Tax=Mucor mucedo TaxID=29922 RepID=UPI00221F3F68
SLSSLIYMEKIDNFEQYKNMLVVLVTETIASMDNLQHTSIQNLHGRSANSGKTPLAKMKFSSLCNRLKAHLLVHLSDDVEIFAGGPHTEAERCEQQHKFMRELLCHTNRHNGSRDVALRFSEEYMLRHMCQGGSFIRDSSAPMYAMCGEGVLLSYDPMIFRSELELLDDNNSNNKLTVSLAALFRNMNSPTNGQTLGRISQKANGYYFVEAFEFVPIRDEHLGYW